jgi:hypothetical protein
MANYNPTTVEGLESSLLDTYGNLRVSNSVTILDITHANGDQQYFYESIHDATTDGSTIDYQSDGGVKLSVNGTNIAEQVRIQSKKILAFEQGKSLCLYMSCVMNNGSNNSHDLDSNDLGVSTIAGFMDDTAGLYFQHDGDHEEDNEDDEVDSIGTIGTMSIRISGQGAIIINQDEWNIDKFDGSGPSTITANWAEMNNFYIEVSWPVMVRFGLLIHGKLCMAHAIYNSTGSTAIFALRDLPVRYGISGSTGDSGSMKHYSTLVSSETRYNPLGRILCLKLPSEIPIIANEERPILTLRIGGDSNGNVLYRSTVIPLALTLTSRDDSKTLYNIYYVRSNNAGTVLDPVSLVPIYYNGIIVANSAFTNIAGSNCQYYLGGSGLNTSLTYPNIFTVYKGYFKDSIDLDFNKIIHKYNAFFELSSDIHDLSDYLIITAQLNRGMGSKMIDGILTWKEIIHDYNAP